MLQSVEFPTKDESTNGIGHNEQSKHQEIKNACINRDLESLKALAISCDGYINDSNRLLACMKRRIVLV